MADEIYINHGTTFQQPYQGQRPVNVQNPFNRQTTVQAVRQTQQPYTFNDNQPYTYSVPVNAQNPFIRQQPFPFTSQATGQAPFTYQFQSPSPFIADQPYIVTYQAQQPVTYQAQAPTTYQAQQPVTYQAQQPTTYQAQQPTTYQAQSPSPYIANQTYSTTGNYNINFSHNNTLVLYNGNTYGGDSYTGYAQVAASRTSSNYIVSAYVDLDFRLGYTRGATQDEWTVSVQLGNYTTNSPGTRRIRYANSSTYLDLGTQRTIGTFYVNHGGNYPTTYRVMYTDILDFQELGFPLSPLYTSNTSFANSASGVTYYVTPQASSSSTFFTYPTSSNSTYGGWSQRVELDGEEAGQISHTWRVGYNFQFKKTGWSPSPYTYDPQWSGEILAVLTGTWGSGSSPGGFPNPQ